MSEMLHKERIETDWRELSPTRGDNGERKMLYELIDEDEGLVDIIKGTFGPDLSQFQVGKTPHGGIIVATERRVVMVDKGMFSTEVAEMLYVNIEAITHSTGMFSGRLRITGKGGIAFRIENVMPKSEVKGFADCVRGGMEGRPVATPT